MSERRDVARQGRRDAPAAVRHAARAGPASRPERWGAACGSGGTMLAARNVRHATYPAASAQPCRIRSRSRVGGAMSDGIDPRGITTVRGTRSGARPISPSTTPRSVPTRSTSSTGPTLSCDGPSRIRPRSRSDGGPRAGSRPRCCSPCPRALDQVNPMKTEEQCKPRCERGGPDVDRARAHHDELGHARDVHDAARRDVERLLPGRRRRSAGVPRLDRHDLSESIRSGSDSYVVTRVGGECRVHG